MPTDGMAQDDQGGMCHERVSQPVRVREKGQERLVPGLLLRPQVSRYYKYTSFRGSFYVVKVIKRGFQTSKVLKTKHLD